MFVQNHGITAKQNLTNIMKGLMIQAKAEENQQGEPKNNPQPTQTINFEDLVSKARAEEKAKLYPKIQKLESDNSSLVEKNNGLLLELGKKDSEISSLKDQLTKAESTKGAEESVKVKELQDTITQLETRIQEMESNAVDVEALTNQIKGEYDVLLYKEQRLREVGDVVIPELISGTTKEEIDASIEVSKARFSEITSKYAPTHQNIPPVNVNTSKFSMKDLSTEDISRMSPQEWAEKRKLLGLR